MYLDVGRLSAMTFPKGRLSGFQTRRPIPLSIHIDFSLWIRHGLTSRRSQRRLALAVPLRGPRFLVRRGSAFFVRRHAQTHTRAIEIVSPPSRNNFCRHDSHIGFRSIFVCHLITDDSRTYLGKDLRVCWFYPHCFDCIHHF